MSTPETIIVDLKFAALFNLDNSKMADAAKKVIALFDTLELKPLEMCLVLQALRDSFPLSKVFENALVEAVEAKRS